MRGRRKSRYRWFPTAGTHITVGEFEYAYSWYSPAIIAPQPQQSATPILGTDISYFPLVRDETQSEAFGATQGVSLRDLVEGQDWVLKRICGSVFASVGAVGVPTNPIGYWTNVKVSCGIAVARAREDNGEEIDLSEIDYDPDGIDNSADSWVWRRTWLLSKPAQAGEGSPGTFDFLYPLSNANYGDIRSGPHIDSKVSRRITREQRLWFIYRAVGYSGGLASSGAAEQNNQPPVNILADIRVLGAMRRGKTTKTL